MFKDIHLFFDCDEWKTNDSMRLICVCDSEHVEQVYQEIQEDHEYTDEEMDTYIYHDVRELNVV